MPFGCCGKTFSCLFIFFNVTFAIVGLATIAFGIFLKVYPNASSLLALVELNTDNAYLANGAWIIIGFGVLVVLVSFCGCVGAASKNRCLLGMYIIFAVIIVIGEIGAFVITILFVVRSDDVDAFQREVTNTFQKEYRVGRTKFTRPVDSIQAWFECCGMNNYTDYIPIYNDTKQVPQTCCKLGGAKDPDDPEPVDKNKCFQEAQGDNLQKGEHLHVKGCFTLLRETVKQYSTVLLIVEAVVIAVTIIGIIIAACLCRRHGEKDL